MKCLSSYYKAEVLFRWCQVLYIMKGKNFYKHWNMNVITYQMSFMDYLTIQ